MRRTTKESLKQLVAKHRLEELMEELFQQLNTFSLLQKDKRISEIYDSLILISGKFKSIEHEKNLGIIDTKDYILESNKIGFALIALINDIPDAVFAAQLDAPHPNVETTREKIKKTNANSSFAYDIFFSFSNKDIDEARILSAELRGYGLRVFVSDEVLKANVGTSYFDKIDYALTNSKDFILLATPNAMQSEWVKTEYETFYNEYYIPSNGNRKFIILKGNDFENTPVPSLLKRLQFANTLDQVLNSFIQQQITPPKLADNEQQPTQQQDIPTIPTTKVVKTKYHKEQEALKQKLADEKRRKEQEPEDQETADEKQPKEPTPAKQKISNGKRYKIQDVQNRITNNIPATLVSLMLGAGVLFSLFYYMTQNANTALRASKNLKDLAQPIDTTKKQAATTPSPKRIIDTSSTITDKMVFINGGTFLMGSEEGGADEQPLHEVTVSGFYLSKYETTLAQFKAFIGETNYQTDAEKEGHSWRYAKIWEKMSGVNWRHDAEGNPQTDGQHPVIHVTWNDAVAFCKWAARKTGKPYRLPTEAEWEYAAGNGTKHTRYSWGNSLPSTKLQGGNVADQTARDKFGTSWTIFDNYTDDYAGTAPVGQFYPNDFGLYDMTGNVWEWCSDRYSGEYYQNSPSTNPQGDAKGVERVLRGGGLRSYPKFCRITYRGGSPPSDRTDNLGFRVAASSL